ncbi:MAG: hypothetical protein J0H55_10735 [Chitinophagaceae bacterium]|nr:hypothetical protein [Chitinophagaceae bacterium]
MKTHFTPPRSKLFFLIIFTFISFSMLKCTKQNISAEKENILTGQKVEPAFYKGPCPYDCDDPRCRFYSDPNSDCSTDPVGANRICGSEFAPFGLEGKTIKAAVDSVGSWHNQYQATLFVIMQQRDINLETDTIQDFLKHYTDSIMNTKGVNYSTLTIPNLDMEDTTLDFSGFSGDAQVILNEIFSLLNEYTEENHSYYINELNSLELQALNLFSFEEAMQVGICGSVAINSLNYWKDNSSTWVNYLTNSNENQRAGQPCKVNMRQLGGADAVGAIRIGRKGIGGGGAAGALAGGLLGAAAYSAGNILGQALNCQTGVVGRVSRWISSWF